MKEKAKQLADLVSGMTYPQWSRARVAIEKSFDNEKAKVRLTDKEHLAKSIEQELDW